MTILIVENEPLIAQDLKCICEKIGHKVVGISYNASQALDQLSSRKPEFAFLDIHLDHGLSGIDIANIIRAQYNIPFAFITSFVDDTTLDLAKTTLPIGYIVKPFEEKDIVALLEIDLFRFNQQNSKGTLNLEKLNSFLDKAITEREFEIITMILDGHSNADISKSLFVSENTIKTHIKRIYTKLDVHNRAELTKLVLEME